MIRNLLYLYEQDPEEKKISLTPKAFSILQRNYPKYVETYPTVNQGEYMISTKNRQYIGYIVLPENNVILIKPKIDNARILLMLSYALKELKLTDKEISFPEIKEFHEILIKIFSKRLEDLLQFGVLKSYTEIEENLPYVKGRILLTQQLRHNMILKHRTYCRYPELTQDILENQIIKFTLYHVIKNFTINEELRKSLIRLYRTFEFVSMKPINPRSFANLQFNRLNEYYKPILTICKILLQNSSINPEGLRTEHLNALRTKESFAFLIDMNKLFETFVREYLRQNLEQLGLEVNKGHEYLCYDNEIELEPDIVITKNGKTVLIIDTKYKILDDENKISREDISQMLAYCHAYNIKTGLLLYPKFRDGIDHSYYIKNSNIEVRVDTIDISHKNRNEFFHNFGAFIDSLIAIFT